MSGLMNTAGAYGRCLVRMWSIAKLAGGGEALERRLAELEEQIRASAIAGRCPHCGSAELEPTETSLIQGGARVTRFRCKACGLASTEAAP